MKKFISATVFAFVTAICLVACGNNDNYPDNYLGFEQKSATLKFDKNATEVDYSVKIIAGDKSKEDRMVTVSTSGAATKFCKLENPQVTLPAGKKSVKVNLKIYPKNIGISKYLNLVCSPADSKIEQTSISISLKKQ